MKGVTGQDLQNDIEHLKDMMDQRIMTADEANVELVRAARVRVVENKLPRQLRNALNAGVEAGKLGHMKKDGYKPEVYYHPTFDYLARAERNKRERETLDILKQVYGRIIG